MFALLKWRRPWMKWTFLFILLLSVATYGFCYFLENHDPNYPWSGDLGRTMKAKGVHVHKFQKEGAWRYHVTIIANQTPASGLEWNEIETIASLNRIDGLHIQGPGGPWVTSLLNAVRELEGTKSITLNQVRLDDTSVDVLNKFESLSHLTLISVPNARLLSRLNNPTIVNLSLTNTYIQDADLAVLSPSLRLESLEIHGSPYLTGENFDKLAAMKTLKKLRLHHLGVDGDALAFFKDHPTLESLSLSHTQVSGRDLREIARNKALRALYVEGTMSANTALKAIGGAENLETLVLQNNNLGTEQGLAHLKGAKNLKVLQLNVSITEDGIRYLEELPNLQELRAFIRINRPVIRELAKLKNLKNLDTIQPSPPGNSEMHRELRAAIPNLTVITGQLRQPD